MDKGLTTQQAKELLQKHGKNTIESHSTTSALKIFLGQFPTVINAILFIAGIFSLFLNNFLDSAFIFAIIFLNAILGFIQEFKAERAMEKLKNYTAPKARVIRDGKDREILAEEVVPGDIVVLADGARIPADGKLLENNNLEVDEAILTGESIAVAKNENDAVFLGTLVTKGNGQILIEKTGKETQFGQIADTLTTITEEKTPLQKDFDYLGKVLSFVAIIIGRKHIPCCLVSKAS